MKGKVGIIGRGNVGSALARGLERAGYEVRITGNDAVAVRETGAWAGVVILAAPHGAVDSVVKALGDAVDGKVLVDATNALTPEFQLALGFTTSAAEELQKKAPKARVVKAFNTVFAQNMESGQVKGQPVGAFVAGDDAGAREVVLELARAIGFDAVDAGPLAHARYLEPLAVLGIRLAYAHGMGPGIGWTLVR
jgi:8-hydroxy-5-deazaflavin:NADPH oxidoreductase